MGPISGASGTKCSRRIRLGGYRRNVTLGVLSGVIFLVIGSIIARPYGEKIIRNLMICRVSPFRVRLLFWRFCQTIQHADGEDTGKLKISTVRLKISAKRWASLANFGVMGTVIGIVIGILAGYHYTAVVDLGADRSLMVFCLKQCLYYVKVLFRSRMPLLNLVQERFEGREAYVGVDCAALLGHPSASAVLH